MDKKSCVFVIGAANEIIEKALRKRYDEEDAIQFMDKIVQVTFNLPQISLDDCKSYISKISHQIEDYELPYLPIIVSALKNNPRRLKRFLNNLQFLDGILKNKEIPVQFTLLLYWNIIDYMHPSLINNMKENPQFLSTLKEWIEKIDKELSDSDRKIWSIPEEHLEKVPESLKGYIQNKDLVAIIKEFNIKSDELNALITFSKVVESVEEAKEKGEVKERIEFDKMIKVSAGEFLYGKDKHPDKIEEAFLIDVYPVTNSRYKEFIESGGYTKDEVWSEEGIKWKKEGGITQPTYWEHAEWNKPDHPVVGVAYYEAEAYASWEGKRLPTEKEWEKAARGKDGREYPWGNEFNKENCNTMESGLNKTTRVILYPNGTSPYGCHDMAGNVWEWTDSWYDESKEHRVLRGGSWFDTGSICRCADRVRYYPSDRYYSIGFRCARAFKL